MKRMHSWAWMMALAIAAFAPGAAVAAVDLIEWNDVAATTGSGKPATADQIKRAFMAGGARRGWTFADAGPGKLTATLVVRKHTLVMDIAYEDGKYSLKYKDSVNLDFRNEAGRKTIHRSYITWNTNLMNDARAELVRF